MKIIIKIYGKNSEYFESLKKYEELKAELIEGVIIVENTPTPPSVFYDPYASDLILPPEISKKLTNDEYIVEIEEGQEISSNKTIVVTDSEGKGYSKSSVSDKIIFSIKITQGVLEIYKHDIVRIGSITLRIRSKLLWSQCLDISPNNKIHNEIKNLQEATEKAIALALIANSNRK